VRLVTAVKPGVLRRRKEAVPFTVHHAITFLRPVRDRGQYIVDAVHEGFAQAEERKWLANRLRSR
jgi:hypothetical protein